MEPEIRIGDHVDPWMRRGCAVVDPHDVAAILGKTAIAIPELEIVARWSWTCYWFWLCKRTALFGAALKRNRCKPCCTQPLLGRDRCFCVASCGQINRDFLASAQLFGKRTVLRMHDDTSRSEKRVVAFLAHLIATNRKDMRLTAATSAETFHDPVDGALRILRIGECAFVDRNDVDRQALAAPIFLRTQHATQHIEIGFVVDAKSKDRIIAGDRHRPEIGLLAKAACNRFRRLTQGALRIEQIGCNLLVVSSFRRLDADMVELNLRTRP